MSVDIDCPSGLKLRIRGLKGKEGRILADKNAIRQGTVLDGILIACTEEVLEPAHYVLNKDGKLDWGKVLVGDRFYVLLQIRIATFGPEYVFKLQCKESACREAFDQEIDLSKDLVIHYLSDDDREVMQTEGVFTTHLQDGRAVKYRLATGEDERAAAKSRTQDAAIVEMLSQRISSIEGLERPEDVGPQRAAQGVVLKSVKTFLEDLEWADLVGILNSLDEHDCGVETKLDVECPSCSGVQEVQLPFGRSFFLPTQKAGHQSL